MFVGLLNLNFKFPNYFTPGGGGGGVTSSSFVWGCVATLLKT